MGPYLLMLSTVYFLSLCVCRNNEIAQDRLMHAWPFTVRLQKVPWGGQGLLSV